MSTDDVMTEKLTSADGPGQRRPVLNIFAIVFWGWVWGVPGAFLGVPLTAAIVIVCREFRSTRWVAALASSLDEERDDLPKSG